MKNEDDTEPNVIEANTRERLRQALRVAARGDLTMAASLYRRTLCLAPDHPTAHYLLGLALMGLGREEEARAEWLTTLHEEGGSEADWVHRRAQSLLVQYSDPCSPWEMSEERKTADALR